MGMISHDKRGQGVDLYHSDSSLEIVLLIEIMLGRDLSSLVLETSKDGGICISREQPALLLKVFSIC